MEDQGNMEDTAEGSNQGGSPGIRPEDQWPNEVIQLPATTEDLNEFVAWRCMEYLQLALTSSSLSQLYNENFQNFTVDTFRQVRPSLLNKLRDCLRIQGVYVDNSRNVDKAEALIAAAKDELPWPEGDPEAPNKKTPSNQTQNPPARFQSPQIRFTTPPQTNTRSYGLQGPRTPAFGLTRSVRYPSLSGYKSVLGQQQEPRQDPQPENQPDIYDTSPPTSPTRPHPPMQPRIPQDPIPQIPRIQTPQIEEPQPDFSRQIANLAKIYTEEDRYSGQPDDSFDFKFGIFLDNCTKAGVPRQAQSLAFSMMLSGLAKDYYYKACRQKGYNIDQLCEAISKRFETSEQGRLNTLKWETLSLNTISKENPGKTTAQCLDILIKQMTTIQRNLPTAYHDDKIACDKLINACRTNEACRFACYKASNTLTGIISDLQSSIATFEQSKPLNTYITDPPGPDPDPELDPDIYYVDR